MIQNTGVISKKVKAELIGKHQGRSLIYNVKSSGPKMEPCN